MHIINNITSLRENIIILIIYLFINRLTLHVDCDIVPLTWMSNMDAEAFMVDWDDIATSMDNTVTMHR